MRKDELIYSVVYEIFGMKILLFRIDFVYLAFTLFFFIAIIYLFIQNRRTHRKIEKMHKESDEMISAALKKLEYFHKLFEGHFKVTDQTIVDLRKQRDEIKKEVKRLKKRLGEK